MAAFVFPMRRAEIIAVFLLNLFNIKGGGGGVGVGGRSGTDAVRKSKLDGRPGGSNPGKGSSFCFFFYELLRNDSKVKLK